MKILVSLVTVASFLLISPSRVSAGSLFVSSGTNVAIPDGTGVYVASPITVSGAPSGATVTRIDWYMSIQHNDGRDVDVDLNDHTRTAALKANLWTGTFLPGGTDSGVNPVKQGTLTTGSLIGLPVNQVWYLSAADVAATDAGYIDAWNMTIYWSDSLPDLTKSTDNLSNLNPRPGDTITASITIQNPSCGSASAGASHVGLYWSTSPSFSGASPIAELAVGTIVANGTRTIGQNILIDPTTIPRTYYLGYKIDDQNEVTECIENNNGFYTWTVTVAPVPQPEIVVRGNSVSISDGDSTPSTGDDTDFGSTPVGTTVSRTFSVSNTGDAALTLGTISIPNGYTLTASLPSSIASGGSANFTVRLNAAGSGTYAGDISIPNNDSNENPFNFRITGTVTTVNQPNLTPYQPPLWSDKIVVSRARGNSIDSTSLTAADTLYIDWAVVNFGTAGAGAFAVSLSVDNVVRVSWSVPSLSANYYQPVFDYNLGSLGSGQHTIKITADSNGVISESSEADNTYTKTINIGGSSLPDFRVTGIVLNPPSPQPGQAFKATVTVRNEGTGSGDGGWLDVWAHQTSVQSCGADGNKWIAVGTLSDGQSKPFVFDLIASGTAGSYTCRAFVDSACKTAESDEGDNQTTVPYTVSSPSQPLPNFVVTDITFTPIQPIGGQPFTAIVTVKNQGAVSGDGKYLDVWVNQPSSQLCGASGGQSQIVGTLAPNQPKPLTFNLIAPPSGGPWMFRAYVDSTCQSPESNDGDNQFTKSYGVNPVAQPDFTITKITIFPENLKPGEKFNASVIVKNQGSVDADGGWLDVWANKAGAAVCGEPGNILSKVGTILANESKTISVANLVAGSAGAKTLRAFVDSRCQSSEGNEANNQKTLDYKTSQRVLLLLHGMNSSPTTAWDDYIDRFNGSAPIIRGGDQVGTDSPIPDNKGVVCYRIAFGSEDLTSGRTGVEGTSADDDEHPDAYGGVSGDYSSFNTLGIEVFKAVNYILSVHPGAQITLLGHSRGGVAARMLLQEAVSSPEKASVVGLLTTGTPHKGSRLARINPYLNSHPQNTANGNYWEDDWEVVKFLLGERSCHGFHGEYKIDVRRPTIGDLADNSTAIIGLQNTIQNLPTGIKYGAITYTGANLGVLQGSYSVFDISGGQFCDQLSTEAEDEMLDAGNDSDDYPGDGIVPLTSQKFNDIPNFPAGNNYTSFPHTGGVLHTDEPKTDQTAHMSDALDSLLGW